MANQEQHDGSARQPQPDAAASEPRPAATREQSQADGSTSREVVAQMRESTPNEVSEKTVTEIAAEAEARAKR
jgi:hypothetical protein